MKLDDMIKEIFSAIPMEKLSNEECSAIWSNTNKALVRAEQLENLAEAVESIKQTPETLA